MIKEVAWLYFLHYVYGGKMSAKSWDKDKRMGIRFDDAMKTFKCVELKDDTYYSNSDCEEIINKFFGAKSFEDAVLMEKELKQHDNTDPFYGYNISKIPYDLFVRHKNPDLNDQFTKIYDKCVRHYNSQVCSDRILGDLAKTKGIKEWNFHKAYIMFGDEPPETITIYRGIKCEYDCDYNDGEYTCWTTDRKQGERFASYEFTGGKQFTPMYSENPHLLIAEVKLEDIAIVVGNQFGESEVVMKNPVEIKEVEKLEVPVNEMKSNMKSFNYQAVKHNTKGEPILYVVDYKIVKSDEDKIRCKIIGYKYTDIEIDDKVKKVWVNVNDFTDGKRTHLLDKKDFQDGESRRKIYDIII